MKKFRTVCMRVRLVRAAPLSLVLALTCYASMALAGRLTDSTGAPVTSGYGECVNAVGGSKQAMEACGDAMPKTAQPTATLEVVSTKTAATITETVEEKITIAASMLFGFDSAELSADAKAVIDERIQTLAGRAQLTSIMRVEGHTDSTGPEGYNQTLSEMRATAVAQYIVSQSYNVKAADIRVVGLGESQPIASNDTADGRAKNRRVEIFAEGKIER